MREREKIKVKIITESLWNRLPQYVKDEINGKPREMVEVVHGKWIPSRFKTLQEEGWFGCYVCGVGNKLYDRGIRKSDVPYIDGKPYELKNIANYCPNCGAKMDGTDVI